MERKIKNQKGITLVALVITIIVMLILVAVSVTVAINGGLFTKAKEAGNAWETKSAEEADGNIVKVNVDGTITTTTIDGAIDSLSGTSTTQTPGTSTSTFTIRGFGYDPDAEDYEQTFENVEPGTTWAQWIDENPSAGLTYGYGRISSRGTDTLYDGPNFDTGENTQVNPETSIENGRTYYLSDW